MENDLLVEQIKSISPIGGFFYGLLTTKQPNRKKATRKQLITYILKYYTGLSFFLLKEFGYKLVSWLTAYYPFSLLFKDCLFHHDNLKVRALMLRLEKVACKGGIETLILNGAVGEGMVEFFGYFGQRTDDKQKALGTLEAVLQKEFDSIYVRDKGDHFRILIPNELFEKLTSGNG